MNRRQISMLVGAVGVAAGYSTVLTDTAQGQIPSCAEQDENCYQCDWMNVPCGTSTGGGFIYCPEWQCFRACCC